MRPGVNVLAVIRIISVVCSMANVHAAKILLLPPSMSSHVAVFSRLGVDLAKLGNGGKYFPANRIFQARYPTIFGKMSLKT